MGSSTDEPYVAPEGVDNLKGTGFYGPMDIAPGEHGLIDHDHRFDTVTEWYYDYVDESENNIYAPPKMVLRSRTAKKVMCSFCLETREI